MKPTQDNVFVTEVAREATTKSGIILTGSAETGVKPGQVLAIGPDVNDIKVGDKIYLRWGDGLPVTHEGTKGIITSQKSILAVL